MLDRLTAKHTYCVYVWSKLFNEHDLKGTYTDRRRFYAHVKVQTGLPGHMVACCFDTSAWMWRSYRQLHRDWRWQVAQAKRSGDRKWLRKLLKREPKSPFTNGMRGKVPIWFDSQIGMVEKSKTMRLCHYVARISTLRRGMKLTIPLNPAEYHLNLLDSGTMRSFQLVKRDGKYHVHVKAEYTVSNQPVYAVRGIDLGVKRSMTSVTLRPCQPLKSSDFAIMQDGLKQGRLNRLEKRIAELQEAQKWEPLKRLRHKRLHVSQYYDRLAAKQVAAASHSCLVVAGYPKGIKYENYRGNGKRQQRKKLARWSYGRIIRYVREECAKQSILSEASDEFQSSQTCHRCGSRHTERISQSIFHCWNCELIYNADYNAAINIGSPFLPTATTRGATVGLAQAGDEPDAKPGEPGSRKHADITVSARRVSGQPQKDRIRDRGSVTALGAVV